MNNTIITEKMLSGGMCSAKIDGKMVFIPGALPQEELEVSIHKEKKDFSIASIEKIITPSPYRREAFCPLYGRCGGCNFQHAQDEYQKELRISVLIDVLRRESLHDIPIISVSGNTQSYRNRFQFESFGLKEAQSNTLVRINQCPIADPMINVFLQDENVIPGSIQVFGSSAIRNTSKGWVWAHQKEKSKPQQLIRRGKKIKTGGKRTIYSGTIIHEEHEVVLSIGDTEISFDVRGFFQSNIEMLAKTADIIRPYITGGKVLDVYSGVGTLSALCAQKADHITLVEHNRDAVVFAERNLKHLPHDSYGLSGIKWVSLCGKKNFDYILIDPPRSGMEKEVRSWIGKSGCPVVFSLSCDPVTHARDLAFLVSQGYFIEKLYALDYYPQTHHLESLAICIKK